jgi:4'-phosphopantetheinyl transferase EntD
VSFNPHPTKNALKWLLPDSWIAGGSFSEFLPPPKKLSPETRKSRFERAQRKATTATVEELFSSASGQMIPSINNRGPNGQRVWPSGYAGSLTHKGAVVLGALVEQCDAQSIGIDLELNKDEGDGLSHILRDGEVPPTADNETAALAMFSVKEAVYKAHYPLKQLDMNFDDVSLHWDDSSISADQGVARCSSSMELDVQCAYEDDWVISTALFKPGAD